MNNFIVNCFTMSELFNQNLIRGSMEVKETLKKSAGIYYF